VVSWTSKRKIAFNRGISVGAVTNIVNEWRMSLGSSTAYALRDLGVTLRRIGISAAHAQLVSELQPF
jgi:hypothetical protein